MTLKMGLDLKVIKRSFTLLNGPFDPENRKSVQKWNQFDLFIY